MLWLKSRMIDCFLYEDVCTFFCEGQSNQAEITSLCVCVCAFVFLQLDEGTPPEPEGSFVDYQTSMVKYSKAIAVTAQEMVSRQNK